MNTRLNKFIAEAGIASRRKADELIAAGRVKVNKTIVTELGQKVDPDVDLIEVHGKIIKLENDLVYYVINKPKGIISTSSDELRRKNVTDLVPKTPRVYPVGRLDADSEGLLILTNDGDLTLKLTHPSFEHTKEYKVVVKREDQNNISLSEIKKSFLNGMEIDGNLMQVDEITIDLDKDESKRLILNLKLHTGYNRQIRKMCAKIGLLVERLIRNRIEKLDLDKLRLQPGQYKKVTKSDIL